MAQVNRVRLGLDALRVSKLAYARWRASQNEDVVDEIDHELDEYRAQYHRAGAQYGASDRGMVRWFQERVRRS